MALLRKKAAAKKAPAKKLIKAIKEAAAELDANEVPVPLEAAPGTSEDERRRQAQREVSQRRFQGKPV